MQSPFRFLVAILLLCALAFAQQPESQAPAPKKFVPPSVRLKEAKTVYVKNGGGSDIPYNVIEGGVEGWGRYTVVNSPEKADIIMEVISPQDDAGGVTVTSKTTNSSGRPEESTSSSRNLNTGGDIKLTVMDAHNQVMLWSGKEQARGGFKQKSRADNMVESAAKLLREFRERVEPESAQ
jgi:hypothetical protein